MFLFILLKLASFTAEYFTVIVSYVFITFYYIWTLQDFLKEHNLKKEITETGERKTPLFLAYTLTALMPQSCTEVKVTATVISCQRTVLF